MIFNMVYSNIELSDNYSGHLPVFNFGGDPSTYELLDDGSGNWRLKLKSSGPINFKFLGENTNSVDIFMVGGGGAGCLYGGGGGYVKTIKNVTLELKKQYMVEIGAGGQTNGHTNSDGNPTSFGSYTVNGGEGGYKDVNQKGGDGGSGGGAWGGVALSGNGGFNASDGGAHWYHGDPEKDGVYTWYINETTYGLGQTDVDNTYEFGESKEGEENAEDFLYAGGGGGGRRPNVNSSLKDNSPPLSQSPRTWGGFSGAGGGGNGANCADGLYSGNTAATPGVANTGGGGGGGDDLDCLSMPGGSGIVIIRNHREV